MKLHHLALRVRDIDKSVQFYEKLLQLQVAERFDANPGECAYLKNAAGETQIELIGLPEGQNFEGAGLFLCFAAENLDQAHVIATEQGMNPSPIRQPEPNARYFYVYDPDGLSIQLREY